MHHGQQWLITPSKKRKRPGAYTSLKRRVKAPLESCMCSRTRGHQYPGALSYRRPTDNSYLCKAVFLRSTGTGTECRPQARIYAGRRRFFRQPFLPRAACNRESMQLQSSNLTEGNPRTCLLWIFFPLWCEKFGESRGVYGTGWLRSSILKICEHQSFRVHVLRVIRT